MISGQGLELVVPEAEQTVYMTATSTMATSSYRSGAGSDCSALSWLTAELLGESRASGTCQPALSYKAWSQGSVQCKASLCKSMQIKKEKKKEKILQKLIITRNNA